MKVTVAHGSLKTGPGKFAKVGDEVEMSEEERKHLDPTGTKFLSPPKFAALKQKQDAEKILATPEPKKAEVSR